jgi:hypothetical protein
MGNIIAKDDNGVIYGIRGDSLEVIAKPDNGRYLVNCLDGEWLEFDSEITAKGFISNYLECIY